MSDWEWIAIAVGTAFVLAALVAVWLSRRQRRVHLQEQFQGEYDRAVSEAKRRGAAEKRLEQRERRREELDIRPLRPRAKERYLQEWRTVESSFVNDPDSAAESAERIVMRLLQERGYPGDASMEERMALVSVDHPAIVDRYRHGEASLLLAHDGNGRRTENLRAAVLDFRAVFEELLEEDRVVTA